MWPLGHAYAWFTRHPEVDRPDRIGFPPDRSFHIIAPLADCRAWGLVERHRRLSSAATWVDNSPIWQSPRTPTNTSVSKCRPERHPPSGPPSRTMVAVGFWICPVDHSQSYPAMSAKLRSRSTEATTWSITASGVRSVERKRPRSLAV